jgi:hypothetical protein
MARDPDDDAPRIVGLSYGGVPVTPDQEFIVAVNNYRQSGGGGFPHIAAAPAVYNAQVAIREAIVAYASEQAPSRSIASPQRLPSPHSR